MANGRFDLKIPSQILFQSFRLGRRLNDNQILCCHMDELFSERAQLGCMNLSFRRVNLTRRLPNQSLQFQIQQNFQHLSGRQSASLDDLIHLQGVILQ